MKHLDLNIVDYHDVVAMFSSESDRGAAVLAASFAESYLATYLRSFMVDDADSDALFSGFGPLSEFSQRIETAYAFGHLTQSSRRDLRYVRKIRNHFAHHPKEADFDSSPVKELVDNLSFPERLKVQGSGETISHTRRNRYLLAISFCVVEMHNAMLIQRQKIGA